MKKNNKVWKTIAYITPMLILIIGLVSFGFNNYRTKQQLELVQSDLESTQETLRLEVKKNTDLVEELKRTNEVISAREGEVYFIDCEVTENELNMIAKTVYGEARGQDDIEKAAVIWCILNRVDSSRSSIASVITTPNQFVGYNPNNPVTDEIYDLTKDVIARWKIEKICSGDVGRVLPKNYKWFLGYDGDNHFRNKYSGDYHIWDWDCWNPYE